ncbi:kelch domain-containing protein [Colletotrichum scovillei]|uniref:Kelch domain-containing protein n=2 Tax=Colletotrichum scovillei TaxID=1209932 RepID=A0A9P7UCM8_9PEZI|nr:kelch domain-containing protein [Colletotrichum scovillei]KAG7069734.1 kelch domain-containing protein [Colletotrichum scovillei]
MAKAKKGKSDEKAAKLARSASTIMASPCDSNNLLLFGGEYFNGSLAHFFNDLHIYYINRDEWRCVTSPNAPLPRSGHAWTRASNPNHVYLFGGEFSSPKQGTFHHYSDFWRLEPATREWTKIECKGKTPPARSGHRMTYWKQYIILFGGFQDTSNQTKYLADVWIFDTQNFSWHSPTLPPAQLKPDARSSFTFLPHEQGAVLYGGYSRVKATVAANKQARGSSQGQKNILKPMVHDDCFFLRMSLPPDGSPPTAPPVVRWERRKKPANAPSPKRAGATMAWHKGRGILFGGVHDVEDSEEGMDSEFFRELFAWNIERNRFFPLALRKARQQKKANPAEQRGGRRARAQDREEELLRQLAALETGKSLEDADDMEIEKKEEEPDEDATPMREMPITMELPHQRFNAQLAVQDDVLYIYGGTFEAKDREFTFDDLYAVDLGKMDGCKEIFNRPVDDWIASVAGSETTNATSSTAPTSATEDDDTEATETADDGLPHPRPFETRRDFFVRTTNEWQEILMTNLRWKNIQPETLAIKEIKAKAFELSEEKWWDCREEITALEEEQEAAGISEVVSLAERGDAAADWSRKQTIPRLAPLTFQSRILVSVTMPIGIQRLNAKRSHPNDRIIFIKPLKGRDEKIAQDFLERIAAQCLPIMKEHHLSVMSLEQYEFNREFVGRNFNAGEIIQLVLKSQSGRWLPFEYVQMVMMHELAHCKQMNHSRAFWAVRNNYAEQMRGLWQRGYSGEGIWGRGALLGTGQFQNNVALPSEPLPEHLCGGTYRSRGRKRKIKPKLSYKEQKERRILKKFGANGTALGADEETKVKLEGGKRTQAKPRVAGSARGRELRAAAALARFDQPKKEPEEDIKNEVKDEDSGESEYEDDPADITNEDAVDIDGKVIKDGKGRGMIKVCEDENPDDQDAQNELQELQASVKQWRQTHLKFKREPVDEAEASSVPPPNRVAELSRKEAPTIRRPEQEVPPRVKVKEEPDDDQEAPILDIASATPTIKREARDKPRSIATRHPISPPSASSTVSPSAERQRVTAATTESAAISAPKSNRAAAAATTAEDGRESETESICGVCSFANSALSITCAVCSHVLDPASVPNAWRCEGAACQGSQYLNPGDFGVCGVCGQSKQKQQG